MTTTSTCRGHHHAKDCDKRATSERKKRVEHSVDNDVLIIVYSKQNKNINDDSNMKCQVQLMIPWYYFDITKISPASRRGGHQVLRNGAATISSHSHHLVGHNKEHTAD